MKTKIYIYVGSGENVQNGVLVKEEVDTRGIGWSNLMSKRHKKSKQVLSGIDNFHGERIEDCFPEVA